MYKRQSESRRIDKVFTKGYPDFPKKFIKHHFKITPKTVFQQKVLANCSKSIKSLDFVREIKKPEVLFTNDSTLLYIYLKKKRANRFDGLVGFTTTETDNKLQFNGYIDLALQNLLNKGE